MTQRHIVGLEMNPDNVAVVLDVLAKSELYAGFEVITFFTVRLMQMRTRMHLRFGSLVDMDGIRDYLTEKIGDVCVYT